MTYATGAVMCLCIKKQQRWRRLYSRMCSRIPEHVAKAWLC